MGVPAASSEDKLNMFESGEEGTLDYRLRFAMAEHAHRCSAVQYSAAARQRAVVVIVAMQHAVDVVVDTGEVCSFLA